ncbi:hypothetical protein A3743_11510 [Oleiphilus sp. HI0072]|nr:hypothetical protein A3743_11510 [Oleiphilus sp. HI0072]KZZ75221.1 hypothetical protein A3766_17255 [Oleiphilus sp. HI0132]
MRCLAVRFLFVGTIILLSSCASNDFTSTPMGIEDALSYCNEVQKDQGRNIAVFLDGTENTESDHTNVHRLYNLSSIQPPVNDCPNNFSIYIKGVGSSDGVMNIFGKIKGLGIEEDVLQGYRYISTHYRNDNDKIYIFGFSRGAAASRILASLIFHAGLVRDLNSDMNDDVDAETLNRIWKLYTQEKSSSEKQEDLSDYIGEANQRRPMIEFLGLWDTVPALENYVGEKNFKKNGLPPKYNDQLCNVKKAAHAMSIDDNRAKTFTPALLSDNLFEACPERSIHHAEIVDEVWFSGAHSDVGGGYLDTDISGVPLNWMIKQVQDNDWNTISCGGERTGRQPLLLNEAGVYENRFGKVHDSAKEMGWQAFGQNRNRHIPLYLKCTESSKEKGSPCAVNTVPFVHQTVIDRLETEKPLGRHFRWIGNKIGKISNKGGPDNYSHCFDPVHNPRIVHPEWSHENCSDEEHWTHKSHYLFKFKEGVEGCPVVWQREKRYQERNCEVPLGS